MLLICEGACNKNISAIDEDVAVYRANAEKEGDKLPAIPEDIAAELHTLKHTKHVKDTIDVYFCVECGQARRYGNTL